MKTTHNAAGQPAGAGQSRPIAQLSTLLQVAEVAIAMITAKNLVADSRYTYECKIQEYERVHGRLGSGLSRSKPEHSDAIAFTAETYARYRLAKRHVYNAERRLLTAVQRAQRGGA